MTLRVLWPLAGVFFFGCNPDIAVVPYPCKNPDPSHVDQDGNPDPCHLNDPNSPAAAVNKFFSATAHPFCEALFACCAAPDFLQLFAGGSVEACESIWSDGRNLGGLTLTSMKAALVDGETVFDQARLDACLQHLEAMAGGGDACTEPVPFYLLNVCMTAFQGQIAAGEACTWGRSNLEDLSFTKCKDGRCLDGGCVAFLKSGDQCVVNYRLTDVPSRICNVYQGDWCVGPGLTGTCSPQQDIGGLCYEGYYCKSLTCGAACEPPDPKDTACDVY